MKQRYVYLLLIGVPGLIVALILAVATLGMTAGFLWLFVYGDNPWPASADAILAVVFLFTFLAVWLATLAAGYFVGKRREQGGRLNRAHVLASLGITLLFILMAALYELSVGNIRLA
jgi:hypothetical protein